MSSPTESTSITLAIHNAIYDEGLGLTSYLLLDLIVTAGRPITIATLSLRAGICHQAVSNQAKRTPWFVKCSIENRLYLDITPEARIKHERIKKRFARNLSNPLPVIPSLAPPLPPLPNQSKLF